MSSQREIDWAFIIWSLLMVIALAGLCSSCVAADDGGDESASLLLGAISASFSVYALAARTGVVILFLLASALAMLVAACDPHPRWVVYDASMPAEYRAAAADGAEYWVAEYGIEHSEVTPEAAEKCPPGWICITHSPERCAGRFAGKDGTSLSREGPRGRVTGSRIDLCEPSWRVAAHEVGHGLGLDHTNTCGDIMDTPEDGCEEAL